MLWIREEFIAHPHPLPQTIVFGHTPQRNVLVDLPYKIGIDTGCVYGNKLSCIDLTGGVLFLRRLQLANCLDPSSFKVRLARSL